MNFDQALAYLYSLGHETAVMKLGLANTGKLLDALGRVKRFQRKHPELFERIPKKELAAYLNLSAETLSRLKQRGKI